MRSEKIFYRVLYNAIGIAIFIVQVSSSFSFLEEDDSTLFHFFALLEDF